MPVRVSNLRLPVEEPDELLPRALARAVGVTESDLGPYRVVRKALDVRDKQALRFVYNVELELPEGHRSTSTSAKIEAIPLDPFTMPPSGERPLNHRPVVVGSGPGGLLCAYFLALHGYRPLLLERGTKVNDRIRDVKTFDDGGHFEPESNYLFGEGGAGTFSDGKLTCRSTGPDVLRVLELFAECKGQQPGRPNILYYHRPHLGSNRLPAVVKAIRRKIEELGGEVRFLTKVEDLSISPIGPTAVHTSSGTIAADLVVMATGHSARDTYEMLHRRGVPMSQKAFQFGVRVEHPQEIVNRVQFGPRHDRYRERLGNADYSLVANGSNDLFTFCMCAGGYVIPSVSDPKGFCTNGMSLSKRDSPYANSGLVVTVPTSHFEGTDVLAGMRLQAKYEARAYELGKGEYRSPAASARDFIKGGTPSFVPPNSYPRGVVPTDLNEVLPPIVMTAVRDGLPKMDRAWGGRFLPEAVLFGPEARGSSPVRIDRDPITRESPGLPGFYPVGEGAGFAGGIISAAVDGLRSARAIIGAYRKPNA